MQYQEKWKEKKGTVDKEDCNGVMEYYSAIKKNENNATCYMWNLKKGYK